MQHYFDNVQDQYGNAVGSVSVLVSLSNGTRATIYSDNGINAKTNPLTTSATGSLDFYAANGTYTLTVTHPDGTTSNAYATLFDVNDLGAIASSQVGFTQSGTGAVATDLQTALRRRLVNVRGFGAVGDGVANDRDAIRAAIAYSKLTGIGLTANTNDTFYLGTFPNTTGENKFTIDFDNFYFETNNCTFTATANLDSSLYASYLQNVFYIKDASNVVIGGFRCTADAVERNASHSGVAAVVIMSQAANHQNISLGVVTGTNLLATMACITSDATLYRCRRISFKKIVNYSGYYTLNFAENGDAVRGDISSNDIVRSYFVYGVQDHKVNVYSTNHLKFTDVLIKRYANDTKNIHVNYHCPSDNSSNASVSIEHQNDTDSGLIEDVAVHINVVKSSVNNPTLNFASYTNAGATRGTTASRTNSIKISGQTNSTTPTVIASTLSGENVSRLEMNRCFLSGLTDFQRFIVHDGLRRLGVSNAAGSMTMTFNVSEFKLIPAWGVLRVWGANNPSASVADYIYREVLLVFSVASDGTVTISSSADIVTAITNGALGPTVTFPAGASGSFNLTVNVNNFVHANRFCRATLDVFSSFEH